jgi:hypothetical protein
MFISAKSLAALPPIKVAQDTMPAGAISRLRKVDHPAALISQPAPLRGWQCLDIVPPQRDE